VSATNNVAARTVLELCRRIIFRVRFH
jgi:hypothetical protein